ncbi:SBBP repeat-containing protein [Hymenobacter volaticus]|uniref:SBBP repeat-containing protein n=1 Tax=Hymenobacter volaticus TaxID=2932254 RepID=A0ABY4GEK2_9BACT|nr:SBBP repeat-containing protein [Hymenobacter volaticus]UOQ69181.1 SBBP repeat-containing protein [Hymenobacter volaticus]
MKQLITRLLLAAGVLLHVLATQAQTSQALAASKTQKLLPPLPYGFSLPVGAPALRRALPSTGAVGWGKTPAELARPKAQRSKQLVAPAPKNSSTSLASQSVSEEWVARYTWSDNSFDGATAVAMDTAGNVYVTGYTFRNGSYDYATLKYSASGQQLWEAVYSGPGNSADVPTSLAVDAVGNVYVTGSSFGGGSGYDYVTVKYNAGAIQLWEVRYNGPANRDDLATSLAVDAAGNVSVTGFSDSGSSSYDYLTLQYSASGQQLWQARYNGPANSFDLPTKVASDNAGNVYVTGTTYTSTQSDYATLKYSTGGQQQWVAMYNGPASGYDLVRDLAVDATGNVTVTGTSDNGRTYNYATAKYAGSSGQQLWAARYSGAGNSYDEATAVAVDATGNVVVTGYANTGNNNWDYVTLKYAVGNGQPLWEARYNGLESSYDEARDVAVDATGNVAVTGRSFDSRGQSGYATVKYAAGSGEQLWQARYNASANLDEAPARLAVAAAGNVAVAGYVFGRSSTDSDFAALTYAAATGQLLWQAHYSGIRIRAFQPTDFAVDAVGNVYVTGTTSSSIPLRFGTVQTQTAYVTIKYSASGQQLWENRLPYRSNPFYPHLTRLAIDATGNVYVTGIDFSQYFILKYSASGQQLWRVPLTVLTPPGAVPLAVDGAGNVYATGSSGSTITGTDYTTLKYSTTGQPQWVARYNGPANGDDEPTSLVVDAAGNVYVSGSSYASTTDLINLDFATVKYSTQGTQLWAARYAGTNRNSSDQVSDLAVDAAGDVYVTGYTDNDNLLNLNNNDYGTVKYAGASGQQLWVARYNGPNNLNDNPAAIAVNAGSVYVTGTTQSRTLNDYSTVKYDAASGQLLWDRRYNGPGSRNDAPTDLAADAAGNVYVTGYSSGIGISDYATLKYSPSGELVWEARYNGPANSDDVATHLGLDAAGNVYVTGGSNGSSVANTYDYLTIKYSQTSAPFPTQLAAAGQAALAGPSSVQQLVVYPNPTAATATVSFRPVLDGAAQVLVYNQLGQQVVSLYEGTVRKGQHYELPLHREKLAPGLYTCSLRVNGQRETVRLLIQP